MYAAVAPAVALSTPSLAVEVAVVCSRVVATEKDVVVCSCVDDRRRSVVTKKVRGQGLFDEFGFVSGSVQVPVRGQGLFDECGFVLGSVPHHYSFVCREVQPEVFYNVHRFDDFRKRHAAGTLSAAGVAVVLLFEATCAFGSGIFLH